MNRELQSKLLLVEGLPSTGKSTNSGILRSQLDWNGYPVRWIHEVDRPHPTLFFNEAYMTEREYKDFVAQYPHTASILERIQLKRGNHRAFDLLDIEWNHLKSFGELAYSKLKQFAWNWLSRTDLAERSAFTILQRVRTRRGRVQVLFKRLRQICGNAI